MSKVFKLTVLLLAFAVVAVSCGKKQDAPVEETKITIENLRAAITGETNASADYKAFSERAAEEGFLNIAKMFAAASEAEAIHIRSHNAVLVGLGESAFNPTPETPVVGTTIENLQAALEGEEYEFTVMYPGFIADANAEGIPDAVRTFEWAMGAEKKHAKLYGFALEILQTTGSDETIPSAWHVCPRCGDLFCGKMMEELEKCSLCGADPSTFLEF